MSTFHVAPVRSDSGTNLMTRASSTSGLFALEQMDKDDEEPRGLTHVVSDGMLCDKGISEDWESSARIYEYGAAANPDLPAIPVLVHPASLHEAGKTRVIPFDLSSMIGGAAPCTSPNLMASYVRVLVGERISTAALATSQAYYVIRGSGATTSEHGRVTWNTGDLFVVPKTDGQLVHDRLARLAAGEALAGRPAPLVRCVLARARITIYNGRCLRNEYVTGQSARRRRSAPRTAARARSPSRSARRAARSSTATRPRPPRARTRSATATPPPSRPRATKTWTASSRRSSSAAAARRGRRSGDDARLCLHSYLPRHKPRGLF